MRHERDTDIGKHIQTKGKCGKSEQSVHLEPAGQKLVLDLQEVSSAHFPFEGLIEDGKPHIVLHILPPSIAMSERR